MKKMKLSEVRPGDAGTILKINGGRGMASHLAGMGLHVGFEVKVIEPPQGGCGAMLVSVDDARFMLGHSMAENITVRQS